jgi:hypothetical protein
MARRISPQQLQRRLRAAQRDYERVKARILDVGFICEGSLVERWMPCGKPNCRCVDPDQRHGPYIQLSWKQAGKTVSKRLSPEHARLYQEWIANRRQLEAIVAALHDVARSAHQHLLDAANAAADAATAPDRRPRQPRSRS